LKKRKKPVAFSLRQARIEDGFTFLWFLAATWFLVFERTVPYLYDDEYGVLGAAAVFAGLDWTAPAGMPYYGFAISFLIAPLYWLSLDPITLYRLSLSINGLLVAVSAVMALRTVRLITPSSSLFRLSAVFVAFSYPAVQFYVGLAMGETILLFCFTLIVYALTALIDQPRRQNLIPVLLGLGLALAPYAHSRGLVFCLAAVPVGWLAWHERWVETRDVGLVVWSGSLVFGSLFFVKTWLLSNFYVQVRSGSGSVWDFIVSRIGMLDIDQVLVIARVIWGQLAYFATASFGLVFVGIAAIYTVLRRGGGADAANAEAVRKQLIAAAFVGFSCLLMFAASVLQLVQTTRADHFFYGRYNEVMAPALLIAALLSFANITREQYVIRMIRFFAAILLMVVFMLGVNLFPPEIFKWWTSFFSISSWSVYIRGAWKIEPRIILLGSAVCGMLLLGGLTLSRRLFMLVLLALFVSGTLRNYALQHKEGDRDWGNYVKVAEEYGELFAGKRIQVVGNTMFHGEALQFVLPEAKVVFGNEKTDDIDAFLELSGEACNAPNTVAQLGRAEFSRANLCLADEGLRRAVMLSSKAEEPVLHARDLPPASFWVAPTVITIRGAAQRACAHAAKLYYLAWARYLLPSIEVEVARAGLTGKETQQLGFFIRNAEGEWVSEWRESLDGRLLSAKGRVRVKSYVRFGGSWPAGNYQLSIAVFDEEGWDWRSVASVALSIR